jgi:hypothetical protein
MTEIGPTDLNKCIFAERMDLGRAFEMVHS